MADKICSDCGETEEGGATFSNITFPVVCDDCARDWDWDYEDDEVDGKTVELSDGREVVLVDASDAQEWKCAHDALTQMLDTLAWLAEWRKEKLNVVATDG